MKIDIMEIDRFIRSVVQVDSIRLAHIEDIAAMKLEAITTRNTKKDFYDIYELLGLYTLKNLIAFYHEKYPYNDIKQVLENLTYFSEDYELEFEPDILNNSDWVTVKFKLIDEFNEYINKQLNKKISDN